LRLLLPHGTTVACTQSINQLMKKLTLALLAAFAFTTSAAFAEGAKKLVVMIAGKPSHGPGQHEHNAGVLLFKKCLEENAASQVEVKHHLNGEWPSAEEMGKADTIVIYSDGGGGHPALAGDHLATLDKEMKRGCGLVCVHYAVEPTLASGEKEFIDWIGGCFEVNWSVNPHWDANFKTLPAHPTCNGVKPFATNDEWYYHMRFRPGMTGVTPILTDVPTAEKTLTRKDDAHAGNPAVREEVAKGTPQHVAWAAERDNGGRGFGFCGGHFHNGWGNNDQRKLMLNAILWTAKAEVPANGVESLVTPEDLAKNLDPKNQPKPAAAAVK
jgi:type 1 glutamine amidotransferase